MSNYTANFDGGITTINQRVCIYWGFQLGQSISISTSLGVNEDATDILHQCNGFTSSYTTNNEAEYIALIKLLEHFTLIDVDRCKLQCFGNMKDVLTSPAVINVFGDSKLVIQQVFGDWRVKALNLQPLNIYAKDLVEKFEKLQSGNKITGTHQPREFPRQKSVDKWARQALINSNKYVKKQHTNLQHKGGEII